MGCYPNDLASVAEVQWVGDPRVRLVIGSEPGPTTKAACLSSLWKAMLSDEVAEGRQFKAIILHDAEDVVHPQELMIFDRLIGPFDLVQLPVVPMIHPKSLWVSGHYADEFAEAHSKELTVRHSLNASIPSAGVGCAFSRASLLKLAEAGGGSPFNASSLTKDYEVDLKVSAMGGTQTFAPPSELGGESACTRGYFPTSIGEAINQKSRWMTGIALAGWDSLGWSGGLPNGGCGFGIGNRSSPPCYSSAVIRVSRPGSFYNGAERWVCFSLLR